MSASSRGSRAVVPLLKRARAPICHRCAFLSQSIQARRHSSTTAPSDTTSPNILPVTTGLSSPPTDSATTAYPPYNPERPPALHGLHAGIILSRPPILTRTLSDFERAFYLYQKRLNERLQSPFARDFFFKEQQPATIDFKMKFNDRLHVMQREIGRNRQTQPDGTPSALDRLTRKGRDAWADEALMDVGALHADQYYQLERLYTEAESRVSEDGEVLAFNDRMKIERPLPRTTEADRTGDMRRLDRALDRTLYLVVRNPLKRWQFPTDQVRPDEGLHETAARALESTAGVNMNTWMVARHPIAHVKQEPRYQDGDEGKGTRVLKARGEIVFYLKGRIMAGQADIAQNQHGVTDFKWLTKDELKAHLLPNLYASVELSMPAQ